MAVNIADYFKAHLTNPDLALYRQFSGDGWTDISVAELALRIGRWQSAFTTLGLVAGDRVALCVKNSVDWIAIDLAALGLGLVVVPLYVDDNPENVAWCVGNAEARSLIVESSGMAQALARCRTSLPPLHVLRPDSGDDLSSVAALLPATASAPVFQALPETTLATICFTSGTSGRPKGVMLSHGNIIANVTSCQQTRMARSTDTFLSILPLSHMFERTGGYYLPLSLGAKVVFSRGVAQIANDLVAQAPTVMFAVPRIFEKFLARIDQTLSGSAAKRWLFGECVARGWRVEQGGAGPLDHLATPLLRALVAKPILARLGGRLRLTVVGGAALDPVIARTFIGLGLRMLQGYGMTEASPVISVNREDNNDPESVGPPLPGVEVKLGPEGELLARGGNIMQGYWRNPEATHASLDAEGWLHTGDIAEIREGRIYIRGRLKDVLVMSNGEKLPPQDVEFTLAHDPMFEQVMLVGEGRPFLMLLTVTKETDEKLLLDRANELLKNFPRWVRIRKVIATQDPWSIDNGLLTPTLKLKRPLVLARFKDAVDSAYANDGAAASDASRARH
ncbi:MAG TPA: long-chain fatty acid--CoA ligase [Casimicrobiaceae bacterium]|nr:long-chain fatty acid--CoA ligase [Casimicrobiaceae bacterium]